MSSLDMSSWWKAGDANALKRRLVAGAIGVFVVAVACIVYGMLAPASFRVVASASDGSPSLEESAGQQVALSDSDADGSSEATAAVAEEPSIVVHIGGCVSSPGVYEMEKGSRLVDAIALAGGATEDAELDAVNLAMELEDAQHVIIASSDKDSPYYTGVCVTGETEASSGFSGALRSSSLVDINHADVSQLVTLPGIGEATANKIVADRTANGPFASIEDIKRVSGIGDKKYEQIAALICVR